VATGIYADNPTLLDELWMSGPGLRGPTILETHIFGEAVAVFVGFGEGLQLFLRRFSAAGWEQPWHEAILTPGDITQAAADRLYDFAIREDGVAVGLGYTAAGEMMFFRSKGPFNPLSAADSHPDLNQWQLSSVKLPSVFKTAVDESILDMDATTQIIPRIRFDSTGNTYFVTPAGVIRVRDILNAEDEWEFWMGIQGQELGLEPVNAAIPAGSHLLDLQFDGETPGILQRLNPAVDTSDNTILYLFDRSFREVAYVRRYVAGVARLGRVKARYPRSTSIHVGRTPSPLDGEGPE
jgi:hypothetical protein